VGIHDEAGFREFVVRRRAALLRTAYLLTGDDGHAEDLVQTALLKTYRHWHRIAADGEPSAYVRRVLVTTATSWRRKLLSTEQVMDAVPERAHHDRYPERSAAVIDALQACRRGCARWSSSVLRGPVQGADIDVRAAGGSSGGVRSRGFSTVTPAPGSGKLRATGPGVEPLELALIDAVPDGIVDRAGRGALD